MSRLTPARLTPALVAAIALLFGCAERAPQAEETATAVRGAAATKGRRADKAGASPGAPAASATTPGGPMQPRTPLPKLRKPPTGTFFGLGPIKGDKDTRKHPFYTGPKPPPRVGEVKTLPVPPPTSQTPPGGAPQVAEPKGALRVVRTAPTGRVGLTNAVTAQFDRPMVPVGSLQDLRTWPVPLTVSPAIDAKARWLGTRTVALESTRRLPYSTRYTATVPAGTKGSAGGALAKATTWTFETPRLRLTSRWPTGNQARPSDVIVVRFDQDVKTGAVADALRLSGPGGDIPLAAVPPKAWKTLPRSAGRLASADPKRTVVLRPTRLLPVDTRFSVTLPTGSYSAEGPLPTEKALSWHFSTYPPLKITKAWCQYRDKRSDCREGNPITVRTTTPLDPKQDLAALVEVTPKPEDLQVRTAYRGLSITGAFAASSRYKVRVSAKLRDVYGQTLGQGWSERFSYRDGDPVLQLPSRAPVVLERSGPARLNARVRNLDKLSLHLMRVDDKGIDAAWRRLGSTWYPRKRHPFRDISGDNKSERTIRPRVKKNALGLVPLDLRKALGGRKSGLIAVSVEADWPHDKSWFSSKDAYASLLVQVTGMGVTARWDKDEVVAYVARLSDGQPVAGATVALIDGKGQRFGSGTTDARGVLTLPCKAWSYRETRYLRVTHGEGKERDEAVMQLGRRVRGAGGDRLRAFIWTDREPYKPGELVQLSGLLRVDERGKHAGVGPATGARALEWTLHSSRGHKLAKGTVQVEERGAFHLELPLPADMDLGHTRWTAKVVGGRWANQTVSRNFQVQHYRAPEFKVKTTIHAGLGSEKVARFGQEGVLEVSGRYYFGAPMAGAKAGWTLRRSTTSYRPPNHGGWRFGRVRHPWRSWRRHRRPRHSPLAQGLGTLDRDGKLRVSHLFDPRIPDATKPGAAGGKKGSADPARLDGPASYRLEAWVEDDARQRISARTAITVHQGTTYAGLKLAKSVIRAGKALQLSVVAAGVDGKRQARAVEVQLLRLEPDKKRRWSHAPRFGRGRPWLPWGFKEVHVARCDAQTSLDPGVDGRPKPATCTLTLPSAGQYRVRARVRDDHGAVTVSELDAYAYGPKRVRWAVRDMGKVELVPDRAQYAPGDTATLLIKSPFPKARGLLTVEREGLVSWQLVDVPTGATAVKLPLDPRHVPNVHVNVTLFSGRDSARGKRRGRGAGLDPEAKPRSATGHVSLAISRRDKRIAVALTPDKPTAVPGSTLSLKVKTTDGQGRPTKARVTVWAVDEGVLALLGYATPDPLSFFIRSRAANAAGDDLRARILVERFSKISGRRQRVKRKYKMAKGGGGGRRARMAMPTAAARPVADNEGAPPPAPPMEEKAEAEEAPADVGGDGPAPTLRAVFASTAFYKAAVQVDGEGSVQIKLPDNATTFRLMAVADAGDDRFGSGEGQLTTRQPVLLRAALPRFANLHDDFDAAAVLHNETGQRQTFVVGARAVGVTWHDGFTKEVSLDAGDSTEVRFRVRAAKTGRATFQFAARVKGSQRKDWSDAVQTSIPVNLPATLEAFATYGSTTSSVKQPIQAPLDAIPGFGGLNLTLSSTALSGLEDATKYLLEYPYGCAEQTASRLIPIAVLGELLDQFGIGTYKKRAARDGLIKRAVKRLVSLQHYDGGFKFWPKSRRSSRWVTPWATYALLLAKEQGAEVPERTLRRANNYLRNVLRRPNWRTGWWRVSDTLSLWVMTHRINTAPGRAPKSNNTRAFERLYDERAKLPMFARAWLMAVAHRLGKTSEQAELLRQLDNAVVEKAGAAHIAEGKSEDLRILMHSSDRTDAIALLSLLEVKPKHATVDKLIRGLMDARIHGRWSTTQANAWALVTARRYFDIYEKTTPRFATQLWLGKGYLGQQQFKGRSLAKTQAHVPMAMVLDRAKQEGRPAPQPKGGKGASAGKVVDLVLAKKGQGRMYYRIGMRYAPKSLRLPAEEQGFTVQRSYAALNPADKDKVVRLKDGSYRIRAGTDVRVNLTVVVPTRGHYVVVDDPLPAGFEPQNPAFRTTNSGHQHVRNRRGGGGWRWYWWWRWDHIEMRDDRVLLFADRLWSGVYSHSYVARATTIGRFVVPPARAEEMYAPETFGRNATSFVEVVP